MDDTQTPRWAPWITLPLAVAGLAVSLYLTVAHYTGPAALACPATAAIDCTKVTTSAQSSVAGVPVALAGALYFAAMAMLLLPHAWRSRAAALPLLRVGAAVAGVAMVLWLVYAELVILHAMCLWCTAVHVITFALFIATVAATTWGATPDRRGVGQTARNSTSRPPAS